MGLDWRKNGTANLYPYKGKSLKAQSLKRVRAVLDTQRHHHHEHEICAHINTQN